MDTTLTRSNRINTDILALANKAAAKFIKYKFTVGNSASLLYPAASI